MQHDFLLVSLEKWKIPKYPYKPKYDYVEKEKGEIKKIEVSRKNVE